MSLSLKPFTVDSTNSKQLDSKEKKFHANINRALERFDLVTEWADYIASLGTLLKALQSWSPKFQNVKYYVPYPYQVSRRLTSSLSPDLPAGVHQKTLEVYKYIFENIGLEALAQECNIWIPGILPLMSYASMSVRSTLIEVYDTFLVQLPSTTLQVIIRPLLASLFPGIDDESSEFLPLTLSLIETLQKNLDDDSLFWQTCFLIMTSNKDRRLGALVWLTKKFPSLNAIPHLVTDIEKKYPGFNNKDGSALDKKKMKEVAISTLLPTAKDLVQPEPGLLVRCFIASLNNDNDLLIKRGSLDILLQRLHLNSPVIQNLINEEDKKLLIINCCKTTLSKDMSLNRRVWNWLLGPSTQANPSSTASENTNTIESSKYFVNYGLDSLINGLSDLIMTREGLITAFKICLVFMDRWEIGSYVIPNMFIPLLRAAEKYHDDSNVLRSANVFFDAVETNIIWGRIFQWIIKEKDFNFLQFIISNFNIDSDEEIVVRHIPLILVALLSFFNIEDDSNTSTVLLRVQYHSLLNHLLEIIPERALLPLSNSNLHEDEEINLENNLKVITEYYENVSNSTDLNKLESSQSTLYPFKTADLTFMIVYNINKMVNNDICQGTNINNSSVIMVKMIEKIPEHEPEHEPATSKSKWITDSLLSNIFKALDKKEPYKQLDFIVGIVNIYSNYLTSHISLIESVRLLNMIIRSLWEYMVAPNKQHIAVKCLKSLSRSVHSNYLEAALSANFVQENNISSRLIVLDLLWNQMEEYPGITKHPLELLLDELSDEQNPHYLTVSKWILSLLNAGATNRLYQILTDSLLKFGFLQQNGINELDDLDMFTYRIQMLTNVLKTNHNLVVDNFSSELTSLQSLEMWADKDVSTYKNLLLNILLKFLELKNNNHAKSIRSSLILLDCLLDGTEKNFTEFVIFLLQMFTKHITEKTLDSELIAVSILDIISKVLRISHDNGIKLDIFNDNTSHMKFIDFMVTSISQIDSTLIITSYVKLLSESITYFGKSIFAILLPLITSVIQCIQRLFVLERKKGGQYQSVSLLIGSVEELINVSHGYLSEDENYSYFSGSSNRGDFIQSVVSNVFYSESSETDGKMQGERDVVLQAFKQAIICSLEIWTWSHNFSNADINKNDTVDVNYDAYRYKFRSKKLLETMFLLEPLEVLENMVMVESNHESITIIHVLDGNKPVLTIPYFFHGIVQRYNRGSVSKFSIHKNPQKGFRGDSSLLRKLSGRRLIEFLTSYSRSLENTAVEEFYNDFIVFFKEVTLNHSLFKDIYFEIIEFINTIGQKLRTTQFGEQKKCKKEISDIVAKYLPTSLADFAIVSKNDEKKAYSTIEHLIDSIPYLVNDDIGGDRFNSIIASICSQCLIIRLKVRPNQDIPEYILSLAYAVTKVGSRVKVWKEFISETFKDEKKLAQFESNELWSDIIYEWSQYPDNRGKLLNELLLITGSKKVGLTPALITFTSWNDSELTIKCQNLKRIAFLVKIAPNDTYLTDFQSLVSCICQYLVAKDEKLKIKCWILLRVLLLKFSESHFNEYWGTIAYCLQTNLQEFFECLQLQQNIDCDLLLQVCKTLDLLLAMNMEGFSATNEWLFIIDTINCVYKTYPYISLVDKIAEFKEYSIPQVGDIELIQTKQKKLPFLLGIQHIESHHRLRNFFNNLSYVHYEDIYSMKSLDYEETEKDLLKDIFT